MIRIEENISLQQMNTFGINARAKYFVEISTEEMMESLIQHPVYRGEKRLILGGGSNLLFTKDFDGLVVHSAMKGLSIVPQNDHSASVKVGAGEIWHSCVLHCIQHDLGGIENLSLIPGTVGAAPIQNIGAYGSEIKNVIENVTAIDMTTGAKRTFSNSDCQFNYRESIFKQELKEKYFISSITLRLTTKNHQLNTEYGAIQEVLKQRSIDHPTIQDVSAAVIKIRQSKLPDPAVVGNAGSFFKNPTISKKQFTHLQLSYPAIPSYPVDNQNVKIPAGWMIEQCGWKGKRFGNVGVHPHQALVLVNYGGENGQEILELAMKIQSSVREKFDVILTTEVNII